MKYTVFNIDSKEIVRTGECPDDDFFLQASDGESVINGEYFPNDAYVNNGIVVFYSADQKTLKNNRPNLPSVWSNESFEWIDSRNEQQKYNDACNNVKGIRLVFLGESDWTQLSDVPLANKDQWVIYRQVLRDITEQSGYPFNVVWPIKPE